MQLGLNMSGIKGSRYYTPLGEAPVFARDQSGKRFLPDQSIPAGNDVYGRRSVREPQMSYNVPNPRLGRCSDTYNHPRTDNVAVSGVMLHMRTHLR